MGAFAARDAAPPSVFADQPAFMPPVLPASPFADSPDSRLPPPAASGPATAGPARRVRRARALVAAAIVGAALGCATAVRAQPVAPVTGAAPVAHGPAATQPFATQPGAAPLPVAPAAGFARTPSVNVTTVLPRSVMAGLERAHVPLSDVSVVIEKVGDRLPSVALNAGQPMMPASTMKLVTTWTALSMLGPDFRWRTSAYAQGNVDAAGVLHGDLYIKGTGDPKLVPEELIDLVQKIRAAGIVRIDGALVLDKSEFDVSTRDLPPFDDDASAPYNVGPDPLLYAFKSLTFTLEPSRRGVSVDVIPPISQLRIDDRVRVRGGACRGLLPTPQMDAGPNGELVASFSGRYPIRCGDRSFNMAPPIDHSAFFAGGFLALWQQAGGSFSGAIREGKVPPGARLVAVHQSPPLADVVHDINKFSTT